MYNKIVAEMVVFVVIDKVSQREYEVWSQQAEFDLFLVLIADNISTVHQLITIAYKV